MDVDLAYRAKMDVVRVCLYVVYRCNKTPTATSLKCDVKCALLSSTLSQLMDVDLAYRTKKDVVQVRLQRQIRAHMRLSFFSAPTHLRLDPKSKQPFYGLSLQASSAQICLQM